MFCWESESPGSPEVLNRSQLSLSGTKSATEINTRLSPGSYAGCPPCTARLHHRLGADTHSEACSLGSRALLSCTMSALGQGVRLGGSTSCRHSVLFGNSVLVLPCCPLPARPQRSLHLGTQAMGRRGLAELINVGKQRRCGANHRLTVHS